MVRENKGRSLLETPNNYVVLDVETTGFKPGHDSIIEFAALKIQSGEVIDTYQTLINPRVSIPGFISTLTGITNIMLKQAPYIEEVLPDIRNFIGDSVIVGHNVNFDINFLYDAFKHTSLPDLTNDFVDTLRISRRELPELEHHKLSDIAEYYDITPDGFHRALGDCYTTFKCYKKLQKISEVVEEKKNEPYDYDNTTLKELDTTPDKERAALYAYAVYQYTKNKPFGNMSDEPNLNLFYTIADKIIADKALLRSLKGREAKDYLKPYRGTVIYKFVASCLTSPNETPELQPAENNTNDISATIKCIQCGFDNSSDWKFCVNCGAEFESTAVSTQQIQQPQQRKTYLDNWDDHVHNSPDQLTRQNKAKFDGMSMFKINRDTLSGTVRSKDGVSTYYVTNKSCSCIDFQVRNLPCKHMYLLDNALMDDKIQPTYTPFRISYTSSYTPSEHITSNKSKTIALILAIFLGLLGAHRFYVGKTGSGLIWALTRGAFYIGWLYDIYCIATNQFTDSEGNYVENF